MFFLCPLRVWLRYSTVAQVFHVHYANAYPSEIDDSYSQQLFRCKVLFLLKFWGMIQSSMNTIGFRVKVENTFVIC